MAKLTIFRRESSGENDDLGLDLKQEGLRGVNKDGSLPLTGRAGLSCSAS